MNHTSRIKIKIDQHTDNGVRCIRLMVYEDVYTPFWVEPKRAYGMGKNFGETVDSLIQNAALSFSPRLHDHIRKSAEAYRDEVLVMEEEIMDDYLFADLLRDKGILPDDCGEWVIGNFRLSWTRRNNMNGKETSFCLVEQKTERDSFILGGNTTLRGAYKFLVETLEGYNKTLQSLPLG